MPDLREAVLKEMDRQGVTAYRLVEMLKGKRADGANVPRQTVYDFVKRGTPLGFVDLGLVFDALGMTVATKPAAPKKGVNRRNKSPKVANELPDGQVK